MRDTDADASYRRKLYFEGNGLPPVNPFADDYAALGPVEDDDLPAEETPWGKAIIGRGGYIRVGRGVEGMEIG